MHPINFLDFHTLLGIFLLFNTALTYGQFVTGGFLEVCTDVRVHNGPIGAGPFLAGYTIGANCRLWRDSPLVAYSTLDVTPCLWNNGGLLDFATSNASCGGNFPASCTNCSLSSQVGSQINLTCSCNKGPAGSTTRSSSFNLNGVLASNDGQMSCVGRSWVGTRSPIQGGCSSVTKTPGTKSLNTTASVTNNTAAGDSSE